MHNLTVEIISLGSIQKDDVSHFHVWFSCFISSLFLFHFLFRFFSFLFFSSLPFSFFLSKSIVIYDYVSHYNAIKMCQYKVYILILLFSNSSSLSLFLSIIINTPPPLVTQDNHHPNTSLAHFPDQSPPSKISGQWSQTSGNAVILYCLIK